MELICSPDPETNSENPDTEIFLSILSLIVATVMDMDDMTLVLLVSCSPYSTSNFKQDRTYLSIIKVMELGTLFMILMS